MGLHMRDAARSWLSPPRRTARLRLTALVGGLFVACGAALLAVAYLLVDVTGNPTGIASQPPDVSSARSAAAGHSLQLGAPHSAGQLRQIQAATQAADTRVVHAVLGELLLMSPIALAIVTVIAILLGWLAAGRILRPLATITTAARRISATSLNERLNLRGPDDELKALGDTLDDLFTRLEAAFDAQKHFVANASHELRTPLTRERTMLQVGLDDPGATAETWRSIAAEVLTSNAEQESLIEALLALASSQGGRIQRESVNLADVTGEVLAARYPEAGRRGLRLQTDTGQAPLDGDPLLVDRLVANLVDNAIRYNVAGGRVEVTTGSVNGRAVLSVLNTGPVIAAAEVDRLFQPFQRRAGRRAGPQESGHGLGLSIVRAIATAHGASITARARPEGGLAIDVAFPPPAAGLAAAPHDGPHVAAGRG